MSEDPIPVTHLYRGSPVVRSWSKHKHIINDWTLCGIKRYVSAKNPEGSNLATADETKCNCSFCLELAGIKRRMPQDQSAGVGGSPYILPQDDG